MVKESGKVIIYGDKNVDDGAGKVLVRAHVGRKGVEKEEAQA